MPKNEFIFGRIGPDKRALLINVSAFADSGNFWVRRNVSMAGKAIVERSYGREILRRIVVSRGCRGSPKPQIPLRCGMTTKKRASSSPMDIRLER